MRITTADYFDFRMTAATADYYMAFEMMRCDDDDYDAGTAMTYTDVYFLVVLGFMCMLRVVFNLNHKSWVIKPVKYIICCL